MHGRSQDSVKGAGTFFYGVQEIQPSAGGALSVSAKPIEGFC